MKQTEKSPINQLDSINNPNENDQMEQEHENKGYDKE